MWKDAPATFIKDKQNCDEDYAICKNCLVKVKFRGNTMKMQSHLQQHHPDILVVKAANETL